MKWVLGDIVETFPQILSFISYFWLLVNSVRSIPLKYLQHLTTSHYFHWHLVQTTKFSYPAYDNQFSTSLPTPSHTPESISFYSIVRMNLLGHKQDQAIFLLKSFSGFTRNSDQQSNAFWSLAPQSFSDFISSHSPRLGHSNTPGLL